MEEEIGPRKNFSFNFQELWEYRELFYFFAWRDIKVKYKQTFLGILWAIIQPLAFALILNFSVGKYINQDGNMPIPYLIFVFSGFILWTVFSNGLSNASNSMISNAGIIKKIYFPRLVIPLSAILSSVFDFVFALIIFFALLAFMEVPISPLAFICVPSALLLTILAALGLGIFLSALSVKYRDFRYVVPFLIQGLLFLTPVIYPADVSGNRLIGFILKCNPIASALEIFKGSLANYHMNLENIGYSLITNLVLLVLGIFYFRRTERYFADLA